jgi:diguanylate cyclase (GGDEF)-like protein/PAS domain S-box-containing protein
MRANVRLREKGIEVPIEITGINKPELIEEVISKWQQILDTIASALDVPVALIMKLEEEAIKVYLSSCTEGSPYNVGDSEYLGAGLYCETVVGEMRKLEVNDARKDEFWKDNPDIPFGMVTYLGMPITWPDGEVFGTICVMDKKERYYTNQMKAVMRTFKDSIEKDMEILIINNRLNDEITLFKSLIDAMPASVILLDMDLNIEAVNFGALKLLNLSLEEILGKKISQLNSDEHIIEIEREFTGKEIKNHELIVKTGQYGIKHFLLDYSPVKNSTGIFRHVIVNIRDITHLKEIEEELRNKNTLLGELAIKDRLTDMYNHVTIHELLYKKIEESIRYTSDLSIAMVDIDDFKDINDNYGHRIGDFILMEFSKLLKENLRSADIIGRYGGEEFLVIFPETESEGAYTILERIRQICQEKSFRQINMTFSAGVVQLTNDSSMDKLVNCADQSLYRAKSLGKNIVIKQETC